MNKVGLIEQNGRFYYGWVMMVVGFLMMLFAYVGSISITSVFVIPVTEGLGVDRAQFVMYQTILTVCSVIVTAYFGKRMAQGNIKLIMVISALCSVQDMLSLPMREVFPGFMSVPYCWGWDSQIVRFFRCRSLSTTGSEGKSETRDLVSEVRSWGLPLSEAVWED